MTFANDNDPDEFGHVVPASVAARSVDSPLSKKMKERKPKLPGRKKFRISYKILVNVKIQSKRWNSTEESQPSEVEARGWGKSQQWTNGPGQATNKAKQGTIINGKVVFPKLVSIPEYVRLQKRVYGRSNENDVSQDNDADDIPRGLQREAISIKVDKEREK